MAVQSTRRDFLKSAAKAIGALTVDVTVALFGLDIELRCFIEFSPHLFG